MSELYEALSAHFPLEAHKTKQGKYTYVDAEDQISRLNEHLDLCWSWEVTQVFPSVTTEMRSVLVTGTLTYTDPEGNLQKKSGCGAHQDKTGSVEIDMLFKTANTEALKNAAKLMGVCLYLYDKEELAEVQKRLRNPQAGDRRQPDQRPAPTPPKDTTKGKEQVADMQRLHAEATARLVEVIKEAAKKCRITEAEAKPQVKALLPEGRAGLKECSPKELMALADKIAMNAELVRPKVNPDAPFVA